MEIYEMRPTGAAQPDSKHQRQAKPPKTRKTMKIEQLNFDGIQINAKMHNQ